MSAIENGKSKDLILKEARRLYDFGLGVHWLKPNSKAPIKSGWNGSKRDDWNTIYKSYRNGFGLGIRLGSPSKLKDGFLAVIDFDVRSPNTRYLKEASEALDKVFPEIRSSSPMVETGRGNGSAHFYFVTDEPCASVKINRSSEMVKVYSPTSTFSGAQKRIVKSGELTFSEIKNGYRMKAAWEIEFMSVGKQVVAPPTLHPDTKERYRWVKGRELK